MSEEITEHERDLLTKVTPSRAKRIISRMVRMNISKKESIPALVWGGPGIGKSQIIKQVGQEEGYRTIELRLGQISPTDLMGIPYAFKVPNKKEKDPGTLLRSLGLTNLQEAILEFDMNNEQSDRNKLLINVMSEYLSQFLITQLTETKLDWGAPAMLPFGGDDNEEKILLFLDEINTAPQLTQAAAYQLVLDHRVGPHLLGKNVYVIAAANPDNIGAATHKMATPLLNRFMQLEMVANATDFLHYAALAGFHPIVQGFIHKSGRFVNKFNAKEHAKQRIFATPRTWEYASKIFYNNMDLLSMKSINDMTPEELEAEDDLKFMLGGCIGHDIALQLISYAKNWMLMPKPDDVLMGRVTKLETNQKDSDIQYALAMDCAHRLYELHRQVPESELKRMTGDHFDAFMEMLQNTLMFFLDNSRTEIASTLLHIICDHTKFKIQLNHKLWDQTKWKRFFGKMAKYVVPQVLDNKKIEDILVVKAPTSLGNKM